MKHASPGAIVPAILTCAAMVLGRAPALAAEESRVAHTFAYEDVNPNSPSHGKRLSLADLYAERGIVLNFLASWCRFCWDELPDLDRLRQSESAPIVAVAADEYGGAESLLALLAQSRSSMPVLLVPRADIEAMGRASDHQILPATYVIDREGRIRDVYQGLAPLGELSRQIETVLVSAPSP